MHAGLGARAIASGLVLLLILALWLLVVFVTELGRSLSAERDARFGFVIASVQSRVEASIGLGLLLAGIRNTQDILEREKAHNAEVLSIDVFDDAGNLLFTTDRAGIGDKVPGEWLEECTDRKDTIWHGREDGAVVLCVPLVSPYDKVVGGVAMRYPTLDTGDALVELWGYVGYRLVAGLAILGLVTGLLVYLAVRRLEAPVMRIRRAAAVADPGDGTAGLQQTPLERSFLAARQRLDLVAERIEAAGREAKRLEELE